MHEGEQNRILVYIQEMLGMNAHGASNRVGGQGKDKQFLMKSVWLSGDWSSRWDSKAWWDIERQRTSVAPDNDQYIQEVYSRCGFPSVHFLFISNER